MNSLRPFQKTRQSDSITGGPQSPFIATGLLARQLSAYVKINMPVCDSNICSVISYQQVINGYQWLSRVINGYQSVVNGYQWLLVINKLLMAINGYQELLMVIKGY